jgi:hypothetical protein
MLLLLLLLLRKHTYVRCLVDVTYTWISAAIQRGNILCELEIILSYLDNGLGLNDI